MSPRATPTTTNTNTNMKITINRPKLTKLELETLEWLKGGRIGSGPSRRTGNTHTALERKGYIKQVSLGNNTCCYEYPA